MPLHTSIDNRAIVSVELAYVGPMGMTMTVGIVVAGKSLRETRQGVSNVSQKHPPFRAFPYLFSCILGLPVR